MTPDFTSDSIGYGIRQLSSTTRGEIQRNASVVREKNFARRCQYHFLRSISRLNKFWLPAIAARNETCLTVDQYNQATSFSTTATLYNCEIPLYHLSIASVCSVLRGDRFHCTKIERAAYYCVLSRNRRSHHHDSWNCKGGREREKPKLHIIMIMV